MQQSAKDRLSEYLPMAMENKNRLARLNDMRDAAGGLTGIPESDGSAHTAGNSHKMEAAVERYLEYEKKIQPLLKANADKMAKLESMVDSIPDGLQREVLRLRVVPQPGAAVRDAAILRRRGHLDHHEARAAERARTVVGEVVVAHAAVLGRVLRHGRNDHAVLQRD